MTANVDRRVSNGHGRAGPGAYKGAVITSGELSIPEARRAFTLQEILVRARQLFATNGIASTSMGDVAQALGITRATLYKYYPSKEELVREAILAAAESFASFFRGIESTSMREGIALLVRRHVARIEESGTRDLRFMYRVLIDELGQPEGEALLRGAAADFRAATIGLLKSGQASGEVADGVDIEAAADDLFAELTGLDVHWLLAGGQVDLAGAADRLSERFLLQVTRPTDAKRRPARKR